MIPFFLRSGLCQAFALAAESWVNTIRPNRVKTATCGAGDLAQW
ncbi:rCG30203 [Rattus norvegicus]|uniref:RCG30203 n=1 Tax=Rattus norvegicus TaxID=10116 RepID=A6ILA0_RAT|nr:rCG30203 [Rattus norvegicus]